MYRSISTQAIVIRRERVGEIHKSLSLLTADLGLISATAYGAYKAQSRLRLGSEPFTWSAAHLYHNPVSKSYKVTELEINASFDGLQEDLARLAAASLWAEIVQKSFGAGELVRRALRSLPRLPRAAGERRRFARSRTSRCSFSGGSSRVAGYQADIATCDSCGAALGGRGPPGTCPGPMAFSARPAVRHTGAPVPQGALRYLGATQEMQLRSGRPRDHGRRAPATRSGRRSWAWCSRSWKGPLASIPWVRAGAMRVFAALPLPPQASAAIMAAFSDARALAPRARWVNAEGMHLTLHFFGEMPDGDSRRASAPCSTIRVSAARNRHAPGTRRVLPARGDPRVLWIGLHKGVEEMREFHGAFTARLDPLRRPGAPLRDGSRTREVSRLTSPLRGPGPRR